MEKFDFGSRRSSACAVPEVAAPDSGSIKFAPLRRSGVAFGRATPVRFWAGGIF
jgi:hypothetical protein